jgi:hypothetical protein
MRTEFFWTLEDGILFGSMTLEKGTDRLSRNVGDGSFFIPDLEGGIEMLVGKGSLWILDF